MKYLDAGLPPEERAQDLLNHMSFDEKFAQLQCYFPEQINQQTAPYGAGAFSCLFASVTERRADAVQQIRELQDTVMACSPHHIPALAHIETATGVLMPEATQFPNELAQASTWNPELEREMATVIGRQARACGIAHGLAPVLDISRDARMGRQGESFGEDPTLVAAMGVAYVQGLQGNGKPEQGVLACAKHFLGFMSSMGGIHTAQVTASHRQLWEQYARPFQAAITEAGLRSLMNCYSSVDGVPAAANRALLTGLLREEMGFQGFVFADYSSVEQVFSVHRLTENRAEAGVLALHAGMDMEAPEPLAFNEDCKAALRQSEAGRTLVDQAALRILTEKFRLGLFENPYPAEEAEITRTLHDPEAKALGRRMAEESAVLLKNNGLLPLGNLRGKRVAVIGWHGGTTRNLFGCYMNFARQETRLGGVATMAGVEGAGERQAEVPHETYPGSAVLLEHPDTDRLARRFYPGLRSLLEALQARCPDTEWVYAYGYPFTGNDTSHFAEALEAARSAGLVLVTLGGKYGWNTSCTTGEGLDSMNIGLPECQEQFLEELEKLDKPTVAVHFDGRPISSDNADRVCNAILEAWTPGEEGNEALADLLLGRATPSGKLPVSIAHSAGQIPIYYSVERGSGFMQSPSVGFRDYVDGPHHPRYAFGHGLSYTTFRLEHFAADRAEYGPEDTIIVTGTVENTGSRRGAETVQLYVTDEYATVDRPNKELAGFCKVWLEAGERKTIVFRLSVSQLALLDIEGHWKVEKGTFTLMVGTSSEDICWTKTVRVTENRWIEGKNRAFYAQAQVEERA
ncbi:MAG: glycoside hydrolase family 3 C-terminal domain-containing protein [Clostridiales bacterium]|nr:glycoside hydrolase family 3 C-terminal domain-containing protein [Clostridiales bacterium]